MESLDSHIPKKPKVGFRDKHCALCKKHGGRTNRTPAVTVASTTPTVLLTKGMGAQVPRVETDQQIGTLQIIKNAKGQILLRYFASKLRKLSAKSLTSARNVTHRTGKVTAIPTTVREDAGRIAQGNYICVRNINLMYKSIITPTPVRIKLFNKIN